MRTAGKKDGTMKKMKARPRNKPFDAKERQYLCGLDAVDACTEKRITWNQAFIAYAIKELVRGCAPSDIFRRAGCAPSDIFRRAGCGPEVIGSKRIERCAARWRKKLEKQQEQEKHDEQES